MRQRILDAAIGCFAARGYASTSNREIAERAGVTSGLLYHYFDSKAALFRQALQEVNTRLLSIYRRACEQAPAATSLDQLALGLQGAVALALSEPLLMCFAGHAEAEIQRQPELALSEAEGRDDFLHFFRGLLLRARTRGELVAADAEIEAGVRVLSSFLTRLAATGGAGAQGAQELAQNMAVFERMLRGRFLCAPAVCLPTVN